MTTEHTDKVQQLYTMLLEPPEISDYLGLIWECEDVEDPKQTLHDHLHKVLFHDDTSTVIDEVLAYAKTSWHHLDTLVWILEECRLESTVHAVIQSKFDVYALFEDRTLMLNRVSELVARFRPAHILLQKQVEARLGWMTHNSSVIKEYTSTQTQATLLKMRHYVEDQSSIFLFDMKLYEAFLQWLYERYPNDLEKYLDQAAPMIVMESLFRVSDIRVKNGYDNFRQIAIEYVHDNLTLHNRRWFTQFLGKMTFAVDLAKLRIDFDEWYETVLE